MENGLHLAAMPAVRARVVFIADQPAHLPRFAGSAWRGAFGHALRRTVCALRQPQCEGCPLHGVCAYPAIFDPPHPQADQSAAVEIAPVAYVLAPQPGPADGVYPPGAPIVVTLRLFGRASHLAGYAVAALCQAAAGGIGPARAVLRVLDISAETDEPLATSGGVPTAPSPLIVPPAPTTAASVSIVTPLRLRIGGDLVTPQRLTPVELFGALVRRVAAVRRVHGGLTDDIDFRGLKRATEDLHWDAARLHWVETTRRSSRQQALMQFGGVLGHVQIDLRGAPSLWPFLWLSQWLHAGKGASMGFGQILVSEV